MSVNIGDDGKRSVQVEVEVTGSPEEVWAAIATGPGISSWFVPTTVDERVGGAFTADFGMGIESTSTITHWDPPHSFIKDGDGMSEDSPPVATQWIVEARSGGKCVVRVVHSWFASTDDWDSQWESVENGWVAFFNILRLKLAHFPGQPCAAFEAAGMGGSEAEAWAALSEPMGLSGATEGQAVRSAGDCPTVAGTVVNTAGAESMMLVTEPAAGVCHASAMSMGEQSYVSVRFYLFGGEAAAAVADAQPAWAGWFAEHFPMG
jgi:uncharacterized protein YndB with AHSA1/START domain